MYPDTGCGSQSAAIGRPVETPESVPEVLKHVLELARTNRSSAHTIAQTVGARAAGGEVAKDPQGSGLIDALRELRSILGQTDVALAQARSVLGV